MILGIIPARSGSKRLPNKNTRMLCGKPLIAWTIEAALTCGCLDEVIVSTDTYNIADEALNWGCRSDIRPAFLATDTASIYDVVRFHLKQPYGIRADHVMLLQPTSPLRTAADIDEMRRVADTRFAHQSCARGADAANGAMYLGHVDHWRYRAFSFDKDTTVRRFDMPPERSIDINTIEDFEACERYMTEHGWQA